MKHRKIKAYEDEPEPTCPMIGSYGGFSPVPKDDKPIQRQIGFVKQPTKHKKCSRPKKN
jgi:hypothetical protein